MATATLHKTEKQEFYRNINAKQCAAIKTSNQNHQIFQLILLLVWYMSVLL
jgi:hypothetical protein